MSDRISWDSKLTRSSRPTAAGPGGGRKRIAGGRGPGGIKTINSGWSRDSALRRGGKTASDLLRATLGAPEGTENSEDPEGTDSTERTELTGHQFRDDTVSERRLPAIQFPYHFLQVAASFRILYPAHRFGELLLGLQAIAQHRTPDPAIEMCQRLENFLYY